MTEHKEIFLEPICPQCQPKGWEEDRDRQWCQDDVWSGSCEDCGTELKSPRFALATNEA